MVQQRGTPSKHSAPSIFGTFKITSDTGAINTINTPYMHGVRNVFLVSFHNLVISNKARAPKEEFK